MAVYLKADVPHLLIIIYYYIIICVGESVTLKSVLGDIMGNSISFCAGKDTLGPCYMTWALNLENMTMVVLIQFTLCHWSHWTVSMFIFYSKRISYVGGPCRIFWKLLICGYLNIDALVAYFFLQATTVWKHEFRDSKSDSVPGWNLNVFQWQSQNLEWQH